MIAVRFGHFEGTIISHDRPNILLYHKVHFTKSSCEEKKFFCWHWIKSAETISSGVFSFKWLINFQMNKFNILSWNGLYLISINQSHDFRCFILFICLFCAVQLFFYNLHIQQLLISTIVSRDMYHLPLDKCDVKTEGYFPTWLFNKEICEHEKKLTSRDPICYSLGI